MVGFTCVHEANFFWQYAMAKMPTSVWRRNENTTVDPINITWVSCQFAYFNRNNIINVTTLIHAHPLSVSIYLPWSLIYLVLCLLSLPLSFPLTRSVRFSAENLWSGANGRFLYRTSHYNGVTFILQNIHSMCSRQILGHFSVHCDTFIINVPDIIHISCNFILRTHIRNKRSPTLKTFLG